MSAPDRRPAQHADDEGAAGAGAGRLGRGEQAAVEAADDEDEQEQHRPDVAQRGRGARSRSSRSPARQEARAARQPISVMVIMYMDTASRPGDDAGDEQLADVLLGDEAVDREHRRGRDHDAERAAGRDHAGGERLRVAVAAHLRIGDARRTSRRSRPRSRRSPRSRRTPRWWRCRGRRADGRGTRWRRGTARGSCPRWWRTTPISRNSGMTAKL